jgi:hypothetical protein
VPEDVDVKRFADEPSPFDAELREFLTSFGQYSNRIQTRMVETLRKLRLNPFAASQGGTRPAELERMFGVSRLPKEGMSPQMRGWYMLQTISGGWLGYMTVLAVANKALSDHWPWQNQEGRELDLDVGVKDFDAEGNRTIPVYIQGNFLDPVTSRASRTLGIRTMLDLRAGRTAGERALSVLSPTLTNEFTQLVFGGPPIQIAQIAAEGKLRTFKTQTGEDLRIAPPATGASDELRNRMVAAFASMNANIGQFMSEEIATKRHAQDPRLVWAFEVPHVIFGHVGRLGKPPVIEAGTLSRIERRKRSDVAWYNVQRYQSTADPAKKQEIFKDYMRGFRSPRERTLARRDFFRLLRSTKKSPLKRAIESSRIRQERAAQ